MLDQNYAETLFNYFYGNIDGYKISKNARNAVTNDTERFLYGEVPFETLIDIFKKSQPKENAVFYDLGSGTGRIVFQSYLLFNFKKSVGVEFLEGLHNQAIKTKEIFDKKVDFRVKEELKNKEIEFINNDIMKIDLRDADFIFMNHPFKDGEEFVALENKFLNELKPGTKITTTIRSLKNPAFKYIDKKTFKFSWGDSTCHFFEI